MFSKLLSTSALDNFAARATCPTIHARSLRPPARGEAVGLRYVFVDDHKFIGGPCNAKSSNDLAVAKCEQSQNLDPYIKNRIVIGVQRELTIATDDLPT